MSHYPLYTDEIKPYNTSLFLEIKGGKTTTLCSDTNSFIRQGSYVYEVREGTM